MTRPRPIATTERVRARLARRPVAISTFPAVTPKALLLMLCARIGYTPHQSFQP